MEQPLITIVMPVYNRASLVPRTLRSIERQTQRPLNVIIVDNNSTDGTVEVIDAWRRRVEAPNFQVTVLSETTPGAAAARQKGLAAVTTPYVAFFDSDDEMPPDHIATLTRHLAGNDIDILRFHGERIGLDGGRRQIGARPESSLFNHLFHCILSTQLYVVRTELIKKAGGWDPSVLCWNDFELGVRLLLKSQNVKWTNDTKVKVIAQTESITGNGFKSKRGMWEHSLDVIERNIREAGRPELLKWVDTRRVQLAAEYAREGDHRAAKELLRQTLATSPHCLRLRLLYRSHLIFGRGTAIVARLLFW